MVCKSIFSHSFAAVLIPAVLKAKYILFVLFLWVVPLGSYAQVEVSFKDSIIYYNQHRIKLDLAGTRPLTIWGLSNIALSGVGYFTARQDEWKYFHEMNVMLGAVNTGIAAINLARARKQMAEKPNYKLYYARYLEDKRLYLTYIGADVLFIGVGTGLFEYAKNNKDNPALYTGFGRSIALQGITRLLLDNIIFSAHLRYNVRWLRLIDAMRFSDKGIGFSCTL